MLFEQAFYTRGMNQISRYKQGLGICASSCLDMSFLDKCCSVGGRLDSERTGKLVELSFYSDEFKSFIGVSIAPPRDNSGGGVNKLCHLFLPVQSDESFNPSNCYITYPFKTNVEDGEELHQVNLQAELSEKDFEKICHKYIHNPNQMSLLLYRLFHNVVDNKKRLIIAIDSEKHTQEEFGKIAREMTWLFSLLLQTELGEMNVYQKRLSYGVHTTENLKMVKVVFTDNEALSGQYFYLDSDNNMEEVPKIYHDLAKRAWSSLKDYRDLFLELIATAPSKPVDCNSLQLSYLRWCLDYYKDGNVIDENDLPISLNRIMSYAESSDWYRKLAMDILFQLSDVTNNKLIDVWQYLVAKNLSNYQELDDNKKEDLEKIISWILQKMYHLNKNNYDVFFSKIIQESLLKYVVDSLWNQPESVVLNEVEEITDSDSLVTIIKRYHTLIDERIFNEKIYNKAVSLYKTERSKNKRSMITKQLFQFNHQWNQFRKERVTSICVLEDYVAFVNDEKDCIEDDCVEIYYNHLLSFAEKLCKYGEDDDWNQLISIEDTLHHLMPNESKIFFNQFSEYKKTWENYRLMRLPLEKLVIYPIDASNAEIWMDTIEKYILSNNRIQKDIYERLLEQKKIQTYNDVLASKYENVLWVAAGDDIFRQMQYEITIHHAKHSFWENKDLCHINLNLFETIYQYLTKNIKLKVLNDSLSNAVENDRSHEIQQPMVCYYIWQKVKQQVSCRTTVYNQIKLAPAEFVKYLLYLEEMIKHHFNEEAQNSQTFIANISHYLVIQDKLMKLCGDGSHIKEKWKVYRKLDQCLEQSRLEQKMYTQYIHSFIQNHKNTGNDVYQVDFLKLFYDVKQVSDLQELPKEITEEILLKCYEYDIQHEKEVQRLEERYWSIMNEFKEKMQAYSNELNAYCENIKANEKILDEIENKVAEADESYKVLETKKAELDESYKALETKKEELNESYKALETKKAELNESYKALETKKAELDENCKILETTGAELKQTLTELQKQADSLNISIEKVSKKKSVSESKAKVVASDARDSDNKKKAIYESKSKVADLPDIVGKSLSEKNGNSSEKSVMQETPRKKISKVTNKSKLSQLEQASRDVTSEDDY